MNNHNFDKFNREFKNYNILLAYLFGSYATGHIGPMSDYDLAILTSKELTQYEIYEISHKISVLMKKPNVDLVILNECPVELKYNIISSGKIIFVKNKFIKVEFEANTLSQYFDFLPILRKQREDIIKGGNYDARVQRSRAALREIKDLLK